jgi:hypothetical protein
MLREVYRREVLENRLLRRIFGPRRGEVTGAWGNLRSEGVHNLYSWPDVIRMINSRMVIREIYAALKGREEKCTERFGRKS